MKQNKYWVMLLALIILATSITGCNWFRSETKPLPNKKIIMPSARLVKFFPQVVGTKWTYFGMAEYSHQMTLKTITRPTGQIKQQIEGKVGDPSGGASKRNFSFKMEYQFTRNAVYEKVVEADTPFPHQLKSLKLLATPVKQGTKWTQAVVINSKPAVVKAEITAVKIDPKLKKEKVTVRYRVPMAGMPNGTYEEIRVFLSGAGVYNFEKTFGPKPEDRFNYHLSKIEIPKVGVQNFP